MYKKKPFYIFLIIFLGLGCENNGAEMNPLLKEYDTPYQIPPFEKIREEHYMPAFLKGMETHLEEIDYMVVDENVATEKQRSVNKRIKACF